MLAVVAVADFGGGANLRRFGAAAAAPSSGAGLGLEGGLLPSRSRGG